MSSVEQVSGTAGHTAARTMTDAKLEVIVIPVSDVDRAKAFYAGLGWRLDADFADDQEFRIVQFTPPGRPARSSSARRSRPRRSDPPRTRTWWCPTSRRRVTPLAARGVAASEVFHERSVGDRFRPDARVAGAAPDGATYGSFASFSDPDGNTWLLQEITTRLPGRVDPAATSFASTGDLAEALRRAAAAHGEHEARTGREDPDWPDWYAEYMVREQAGEELPA